jgi:RNA recognition motif-containing protein
LYVGNLAYEVTWRELKDHMRGGGGGGTGENPETWEIVRADVLVGRDGRSRGCGIVEYGSSEEAAAAAGAMNDTELAGRKIFVREDREEGGSAAAASSSGGGGGPPAPSFAAAARAGGGEGGGGRSVYVGNLAYEVAWQDLKDHMRSAGDVLRAEVLAGRDGRSRGCGTVEYATSDGAARAMSELHDSELMGRPIFVREDRERRGVGGGDGGGNGNGGTGGGGGGGGGGGAREGDGVYLAGGGFQQHRVVVVGGGGGGGPMGNNALAGGNNLGVYVGNLAYEVTWQELKDHMRAAGNVDKVSEYAFAVIFCPLSIFVAFVDVCVCVCFFFSILSLAH